MKLIEKESGDLATTIENLRKEIDIKDYKKALIGTISVITIVLNTVSLAFQNTPINFDDYIQKLLLDILLSSTITSLIFSVKYNYMKKNIKKEKYRSITILEELEKNNILSKELITKESIENSIIIKERITKEEIENQKKEITEIKEITYFYMLNKNNQINILKQIKLILNNEKIKDELYICDKEEIPLTLPVVKSLKRK